MDAFKLILVSLAGWMNRQQQHVIEYLQEEVRVLKEQQGSRRLKFTDEQRSRLARKAKRIRFGRLKGTTSVSGHCAVPDDLLLGRSAPDRRVRVRRALPSRAQPPGSGEQADRTSCRFDERDRRSHPRIEARRAAKPLQEGGLSTVRVLGHYGAVEGIGYGEKGG